jgi:hypothetical protein
MSTDLATATKTAPTLAVRVAQVEDANDRRARILKETGERARAVRMDIGRMLEIGLLIDVDVHGLSMLKTGVTWEDLGVRPQDARRKRITRGQKYLAPAKYVKALDSIETRLRLSLYRHTEELDAFRPWYWMPFTAYDHWKAEWAELLTELEKIKDDLLDHYEEIIEKNREYFEGVAKRAWAAYQAGRDEDAVVITKDKKGKVTGAYRDFDEFREHVVEGALEKMPSRHAIKRGIYADYKTGYLITPPEIAALQHQEDVEAYKASQEKAKAAAAWDEKQHQKELQRTEERAANIKLQAMKEAELEHARKQLETAVSPYQEAIDKFRARIYEDVLSISKSLKKNGTLVGRVAGKARGLTELYQMMGAATGDAELKALLDELDAALDKPGADGKYNAGAISEALNEIIDVTELAADEIERRANAQTRARGLRL